MNESEWDLIHPSKAKIGDYIYFKYHDSYKKTGSGIIVGIGKTRMFGKTKIMVEKDRTVASYSVRKVWRKK